MKILNTTRQIINEALRLTNLTFDNNVMWNRSPECLNFDGTSFRLTLRVKDSSGKGHRLSQSVTSKGNRRKMVSACWHIHGFFFDHLFNLEAFNNEKGLKIRSAGQKIDSKSDNWKDFNVGSQYQPIFYSELCECD